MINNNNKMSNISITTAIDYANGLPHIGHLFEKTIADFLFRYYSSFSRNMLCNIGLDEHGLKIQNFSLKLTILPINSTNITCNKFKVFFKNFCINYSNFIRTSSFSHFKTCNYLIKFLKTHTYLDYYNGYYSVKEELFLTDRDLVNGYF
ncbi:hypothetical protein E5P55_00125 [Candidatus Pinguicoccus supinus]|uniref:Methionyl/Leucyl tRNA synthetase domain-containing protein n=1 Tax=Candidatus Pinguicoccus supinus TaxID=2529394 RepID=A0A7T0FXN8_9BACT|nr:hypothetical protein E5P55_00125 [Candidatus Pinguicoccus supinus]